MNKDVKYYDEYQTELIKFLTKILHMKCGAWTRSEQENGGQVIDHLSDHFSRSFLENIPSDIYQEAWKLFDERCEKRNPRKE